MRYAITHPYNTGFNTSIILKKQREKAYYEEAPQIGGRRPSRIRQQINRGMTVFVIVAACILFYFALLRLGHISDVIFKI